MSVRVDAAGARVKMLPPKGGSITDEGLAGVAGTAAAAVASRV
jgi:hypothetical protein